MPKRPDHFVMFTLMLSSSSMHFVLGGKHCSKHQRGFAWGKPKIFLMQKAEAFAGFPMKKGTSVVQELGLSLATRSWTSGHIKW